MKLWLVALLSLFMNAAVAQEAVPAIPYESVPNLLKLPDDMHLGEVAGVAVNSKGHIFVYSRGGSSHGPAYGNTASQLLEFDPKGRFVREIGKNLYAWAFAHTVRIDKDDNIWATDKGSDMIIKFNPKGRVEMVFGRKSEASDTEAKPHERTGPPPEHQDGRFRQPTDVAWGPDGTIYISDGYVNSRVAKISKDGDWIKSWGKRGKGPGEFNTPHSIAADAKGNIYVADRFNRRIQVFDGDGNFQREIKIDVPFDENTQPAIGAKPDLKTYLQTGGTMAPGAPWAICITPRPEPGAIRLRRLSGAHLQALARRQDAGRARRLGQAAQAVRLDPRDGLSVGEHAVRRGSPELACPEAHPASGKMKAASKPMKKMKTIAGRLGLATLAAALLGPAPASAQSGESLAGKNRHADHRFRHRRRLRPVGPSGRPSHRQALAGQTDGGAAEHARGRQLRRGESYLRCCAQGWHRVRHYRARRGARAPERRAGRAI